MSDNSPYLQARKTTLSGSGVTSTATTIILSALVTPQGASVVTADIGTKGYATLEAGTTREENISFTTITQNADGTATLTGVTRGLNFVASYAETSGLKQAHAGGTDVIISNSAPFYDNFLNKNNDETITQTHTFSTSAFPKMSDSTTSPTDSEELATKGYVDTAALGTVNANKLVVSGTAGTTVALGEVVYLDETDNEWKLADGSASATCDNVQLGIAQGAGTNGAVITGGVLLSGRDTNQTGLAQGDKLYISDTGGAIATSAGTVEVELGHAISATAIDFAPKFSSYTTKDQRDAMAGTSGTPSTSNKFITEDDVSDAAVSGKVVRATGTALPALDASNLTGLPFTFGGDGSDGALNVTSGTTNIDASSTNVVVKNYTSINVSAGAILGLTNPASDGTVLILKSLGAVTIAGTIELSGDGAIKETDGYDIFDSTSHTSTDETGGTQITENLWYYTTLGVFDSYHRFVGVHAGSGGADGNDGPDDGVDAVGGAGGRGGGAIIIECGGALNFTGEINVNGATGSVGADNTTGAGAGGGAGGAAGSILVYYSSLTSSSGTLNAKGGAGGDGGSGGADASAPAAGGKGGGGAGSLTGVGQTGANGGVEGSPNPGQAGSNGANTNNASGASGAGGGGAGSVSGGAGGTGGTQGSTDTNHTLILENLYL